MANPGEQRSRRAAGLALRLLPVALAAVLAGCGSSHGTGTAADPATAVPASAPVYAGAVVRPGGSLQSAAAAAGRTLTHQHDPYLALVALLQTPGSPPLNFGQDIAPWLGPNAGIFLSSLSASATSNPGALLSLLAKDLLGQSSSAGAFPFGAQGPGAGDGAIVMDTSDVAKASSFLRSQAQHAGAQTSTYRGVRYESTAGGLAFAMVDRFAVIGTQDAVQGVIDTTLGGPSLAQSADYSKLLAVAPAGTLAHVFAASTAAASSAGAKGPAGTLEELTGGRPTNISLVPASSSIALDADSLGAGSGTGGLLGSLSGGAQAAGQLPGESWLAAGLADAGATLGGDVQGLRSIASLASSLSGSSGETQPTTTFSLNALLEGILAPLSVLGGDSPEARRDFASWMGSAGIFASGVALAELRAGAVIESKNPSASSAAVGKLGALLRKGGMTVQPSSYPRATAAIAVYLNGIPITLNIVNVRDAQGQTKFIMGLGEPSVTTALNPPSTLAGSSTFNAAAAVLGEGIQPSLTVDFPTLIGLFEAVGFSEDPTVAKLLPYARTLTRLSGGGKSLGDGIERLRMVLGLQQTG